MSRRLILSPPLAIARVGPSDTPLCAFEYAANDLSPRGTGKTTIEPAPTLSLDREVKLTESSPERIQFKDDSGIRPVCVFFELRYTEGNSESYPVTQRELKNWGVDLPDVCWSVKVANLKAFHNTRDPATRISACIPKLQGNDTLPQILR